MSLRRQSTLSPQAMKNAKENYGHFSTFMVHDDALYEEIASALLDSQGSFAQTHPTTLDLFDAELSRFTDYVVNQHACQERSAKALLVNSFTLVDSIANAVRRSELLQGLRHQADEQLHSCLMLHRFTKKNTETLAEVAQYADQQLRTACNSLLQHQKRRFPGADSGLPVVFSDIYATLHTAETTKQQTDDKWVAPSSFERTTIKYWVEEDNLAEVLLLASANAPLLVYGRTGRLTSKADCLLRQAESNNKLWDSLVTPISSVYFDSPKLDLYSSRIVRDEGSQLLRVRWYGSKPEGKQPIFIELKTHHEKWINSKSVKERVTIQAQDMDVFLASKPWTNEDALELVLKANPTLSGESLQKSVRLLLTMHETVIRLGLRPCVRSVYKRAAFQSAQSNSLRLTVDRGVTLFDETSKKSTHDSNSCWCLSDNECATIGHDLMKQVPFAIFEVKLSNSEMPSAIQAMEDTGIIVKAAKFSKFLTGVAAFNASKVDKLPYWTDNSAFTSLFNSSSMIKAMDVDPQKFTDADNSEESETTPFTQINSEKQRSTYPNQSCSSTAVSSFRSVSFMKSSSSMKKRSKAITPDGVRIPKEGQDQEMPSSIVSANKVSPRTAWWKKDSEKGARRPRIVSKTPVRVEPKSYFANERTFIQWISGALLLVTVAAIILDFNVRNGAQLKAGFAMIVCGAILVFYATFVYFRRLKLLSSGSPYGYIDRVGPLFLAGSVLVGVIVLSIYYFHSAGFDGSATLTQEEFLHAKAGECTQHSVQGIPLLEYQPSDVIVDTSRKLLLVPSLSFITGLPLVQDDESDHNFSVAKFAEVADTDLECLTYVGDRLFAVSEGPQKSRLIEFEWNYVFLGQVQELELPTPNVEGIAFVPDQSSGMDEGTLYVAGNSPPADSTTGYTSGILDVYRVPPNRTLHSNDDEEVTMMHSRRLNNNLLNDGLVDSKIAALTYFEGVLYILHDNARVVRAWDIDQGAMLSEWKLPSVKEGLHRQWEGLALERREVAAAGSTDAGVRGAVQLSQSSTATTLILHLTLDSPPQVWSLVVQEGAIKGELILPDCAI